jgi:multiple sugar transport system permease protein
LLRTKVTVASTAAIENDKWSRTVWNTWLPFVLPPFVTIVLIIILPTIQLIANSFYRWSLLSGMKRFDGVGQYVEVLSDSLFTGSLFRTLVYTVIVVALELMLGMAIACLFNREFPGIRVVRTLYLTPMLMVPVMVGLLWSLMYQPSIGVVNFVLGLIGIEPVHWLSSSIFALPAIGIAEIWQWTPFVAVVFVAALQGLPSNVIAAARLDGARRLQRLLAIEIPMMRNVIAIIFLLRFIDVFKTFGLIYVMTRGGPGRSTMVAGFYPWEIGFSQLLMGKASAAAFILMNLISVLTLVLLRFVFRERTWA